MSRSGSLGPIPAGAARLRRRAFASATGMTIFLGASAFGAGALFEEVVCTFGRDDRAAFPFLTGDGRAAFPFLTADGTAAFPFLPGLPLLARLARAGVIVPPPDAGAPQRPSETPPRVALVKPPIVRGTKRSWKIAHVARLYNSFALTHGIPANSFSGSCRLSSCAGRKSVPRCQRRPRRGRSSVGRALEWHSRGQGFDRPRLHGRAAARFRRGADEQTPAWTGPGPGVFVRCCS